jgi:CubicO group peptidase (beta-lactamase class C family)
LLTKNRYLYLVINVLDKMNRALFFLTSLLCAFSVTIAQPLVKVTPEQVGLDNVKLRNADEIIELAISKKEIPGAVLAVVRNGKMAYLKAYGNKQVYPTVVQMDVNTEFDMASCTKPMATAISAMMLVEKGLIRLQDNVSNYIPQFTNPSKNIQIVNLLTHTSGLPSYAPESLIKKRYGTANPTGFMQYIDSCKRDFEPGKGMEYSCLNFITLQHVIENVSGESLRDFAKENIFDVLGMNNTDFNPTGELLACCAPTSRIKDGVLKGVVHDPLAREFNCGISGNAGLFSNANDIAILAATLQNGGEWNGKSILSPATVKAMRTVPDSLSIFGRTLGWDMSSHYSGCKGNLLGPNTYCHTGYTGTSIVIDPDNDISIILLTNRVHPIDKGSVVKLRALVANAVASSIMKENLSLSDKKNVSPHQKNIQ